MTDVWNDLSREFLHLYPRGRRLVAVAGAETERSRTAADALSAALTTAGHRVERAHTGDGDESVLRADVVGPFRQSGAADAVLLVSGPATLLGETARGMWNYVVWHLAGDEPPHSVASALVDLTDPAHPTRRFADYCALPASYGA